MISVKKALLKAGPCLPMIAVALSGCATVDSGPVIKAGDKVGIHFTCRLPSGELAAATDPEIAAYSHSLSRIYMKGKTVDPLIVEAGAPRPANPGPEGKSFEDEIIDRLALAVVGMKEGETTGIDLVAERAKADAPGDHSIKMARVRYRPKEMKLTSEGYRAKTGRSAAVGLPFIDDPALPGKVASVSGEEVLIRFAPESNEIELPYGKATVREKGDQYEIDIHAVKGALVRTGPLVGRIVDVDADFIKIDYGHPFGGEALKCDVNVKSEHSGQAMATWSDTKESDPAKAQNGDLVTVNFTATLEDGAVFTTTSEGIAKDPARKKVSWYSQPPLLAPEEIVAGNEEILPGLGEAVAGMAPGEKKQLKLGPDKAFGPADPQKLEQFPCSRTIPRVIRIPAADYLKQYSSFPIMNKEIEIFPYFKSRVSEVTEKDVALEAVVKDGQTATDGLGTVTLNVAGDTVTTTLKPLIGAKFQLKDGIGIISASDGKTFTVDGNPLAGKTIVIDLEVVKVTKAAALKTKPIEWFEDQEKGLARAKEEGKPVFLLLYADWCHWCQKTQTETIPDPRISRLRDKFVWVRLNSDKEKKYYEQYGQKGFPMIVLLKPDGSVLKRIDGYRDARGLKGELEGV